MDPLSALSVAASVIAVVDFSTKLIATINEIRDKGSSKDIDFYKDQALRLKALNAGLQEHPRQSAGTTDEIARIEKEIKCVVKECTTSSDRLLQLLDRLIGGEHPGASKTVQLTIRTIWHKPEVNELLKRLRSCRQELCNLTISLVNAKSDFLAAETTDRLERLEKSNKKIVEIVTFTQSMVHTRFSKKVEDRIIDRRRINLGSEDQRAVAAVFGLNDGTSEMIYLTPGLAPNHHVSNPEMIETTVTFCNNSRTSHSDSVTSAPYAFLSRAVLDALYFEGYSWREQLIDKSHERTFGWIFEQNPSDVDFVRWLKDGTNFFWVSGKPGSGKSTLMKFIQQNPKTREALIAWAGDASLVIASWFFWNSGSELQKNEEGLLRALLFSILRQRSQLIPLVFPDLCRKLLVNEESNDIRVLMSFAEIQRAFQRLFEQTSSSLKICLFIDGLDESSNHEGLIELLRDISTSRSVKIVVSSRPWNMFHDAFGDGPSIRMEDLTRQDIEAYVKDHLFSQTRRGALLEEEPERETELQKEITDKAQGVFLWVVLVVKSVRHGLTNRDSFAELQWRINILPSDLEDLFRALLHQTEPLYRPLASRIFQVFLRSSEVQKWGSISLLQLTYVEESTLATAVEAPRRLLDAKERKVRCDRMEKRLAAICQGLLEVRMQTTGDFSGSSAIDANVVFLHRTVHDFFAQPDVWKELRSAAPESFDKDAVLLATCLHELKALPVERAIIFDTDRIMINLWNILTYARILELSNGRAYSAVLNELNRTITECWNEAERFKLRASDRRWSPTKTSSWAEQAARVYLPIRTQTWLRYLTANPFLGLATLSGCVLFVADQTLGSAQITRRDRTALLGQTVTQFFRADEEDVLLSCCPISEDKFNFATAAARLLAQGADANSPSIKKGHAIPGVRVTSTPWEYFLYHSMEMCTTADEDVIRSNLYRTCAVATQILDMFRSFVEAGADTKIAIPVRQTESGGLRHVSVSGVLQQIHDSVCDPSQRCFRGSPDGEEEKEFRKRFEEVTEAMEARTVIGRVRKSAKPLLRQMPHIGQAFLNSAVSGLFFLVVAWLLGVIHSGSSNSAVAWETKVSED